MAGTQQSKVVMVQPGLLSVVLPGFDTSSEWDRNRFTLKGHESDTLCLEAHCRRTRGGYFLFPKKFGEFSEGWS